MIQTMKNFAAIKGNKNFLMNIEMFIFIEKAVKIAITQKTNSISNMLKFI